MGTTLLVANKPKPRLTATHLALVLGVTRAAVYANPKYRAIAKEGDKGMEWEREDIEALIGPEPLRVLDEMLASQRRWFKTITMAFLLDVSEEYLRNTNAPRKYLEGNGDDGEIRPVRWDPDEVFHYFETLPAR